MLKASHKKRFIAGAVCPACKQEDKIQLWLENGLNVFQCVSCGHREEQAVDGSSTQAKQDESQPLRFVNAGDK
ncbi:YheV family putative zinc ribbon protein [Agaribacterium sp. ZY112]|uniref:YheV family putative zinc ribbon protein n=1 Tax=Agaribacterium sp. ZY112 TaxID=3233574 RepID=UPI003525B2CF